ncbi:MAG: helix-turn-helix transcriptional regulator [Chitinophagaceae bacterium]
MDNDNIEDFSEMDDLIKATPKETTLFVSHSMSIPEYVLIKLGDRPQNFIAQKLGVTEAQVSKWLSGASNMTLRTMSKIESALDIKIINPEIIKVVKAHFGVSETITGEMLLPRNPPGKVFHLFKKYEEVMTN